MAVLELLLQANRLNEDAERAKRSLDGIKDSAVRTETAVAGAGKSMSAAFQTAGGAVQLAGGVQQVATAFQTANLAAASLGSARFLVELGQTARDFSALRTAVGATGGVFTTLGAIIRANPLLTLATVLAGVATAMGLFGSKTAEAGAQIDIAKQKADSFRNSLQSIATAAASGQSLAGAVRGFLANTDSSRNLQNLRFGQASLSDFAFADPRFRGATTDPDRGREFISIASLRAIIPLIDNEAGEGLLRTRRGRLSGGTAEEDLVERSEFDRYLRERLRRGGFDEGFQTSLSPAPATPAGSVSATAVRQFGTTDDEFLAQARVDYNTDQQEQAAARMREMVESARQVGAYLGDAFFDAVSGAQSVRQVLAAIVSDFARQGTRSIFSSIAGSIAGGFGQTPAQAGTQPRAAGGG